MALAPIYPALLQLLVAAVVGSQVVRSILLCISLFVKTEVQCEDRSTYMYIYEMFICLGGLRYVCLRGLTLPNMQAQYPTIYLPYL